MKKIFLILTFLFAIFIVVVFLKQTPTIIIQSNVKTQSDNSEIIELNIHTYNNFHPVNLDNLTVQITHKYNKGINETYTITPYATGCYYLYYVPSDLGEYNLTFNGNYKNEIFIKNRSVAIDAL